MAVKYTVELTSEERAYLEALVGKGKPSPAYKIKHAHILLNVDVAGPIREDREVAELFRCHRNTVANVRQRFVEHGLEAALERKKRATPPVAKLLDGRQEARLITLSCSSPPKGRARWTLRLLADELVMLEVVDSISYETVRQTLKKRTEAASANVLGDSAGAQRRFCSSYGGGADRL